MFEDIISGLASYLGTTEATVELLLSVAILIAIGLSMTVARVNIIGTSIVLIAVIGLLTVMGWMPQWILYLIILATAAMFGLQIFRWLTGDSGGG